MCGDTQENPKFSEDNKDFFSLVTYQSTGEWMEAMAVRIRQRWTVKYIVRCIIQNW